MKARSCYFLALSSLTFMFWSPHLTGSQTYSILTPENSFCPSNDTCFTLTQFASTVSTHRHADIVSLKLLPGNHTLDVKMVITNIRNFSLYALQSDTGTLSLSKDVVINCIPSAGLTFISCDNVEISNVQFSGCTNNIVESVSNFTIMFTSFVGRDNLGSVLVLNRTSDSKILHCCFVLNNGSTDVSLSSISGKHKIIDATFCKAVVIMDVFFFNNTKAVLIFAKQETNIVIKDSIFVKNVVSAFVQAKSDSSISVNKSNFTRNSFIGAVFAMHIEHSVLKINSAEFSHNDNRGTGGAIYALESSIQLKDDIFRHFNTSNNGGVIACYDSDISINATSFEHNTARRHGGVLYANSTDIIIEESLFRFNSALVGGVLSTHRGTATINGSEFYNNRADNNMIGKGRGGVIVTERAVIKISNSLFKNNTAESGGVMECYHTDIIVFNTGYYFNVADYNGIVYIYRTDLARFDKVTFKYNVGEGGIMYLYSRIFCLLSNFHL